MEEQLQAARQLRLQEAYEESIQRFRDILDSIHPSQPDATRRRIECLIGLASNFIKTGAFEDCIAACQEVLALDNTNLEGRFRRAQAYVGLYQPVVAVSELLAAVELAPDHPVIQRCLMQLLQLLRRGQYVGVQRQVLVQVFASVLEAELNEDDEQATGPPRVGRISDPPQSEATQSAAWEQSDASDESLQSNQSAHSFASTTSLVQQREYTNYDTATHSLRQQIGSKFPPHSWVRDVDTYTDRCYCGQFSEDGSLFITSAQDEVVRVYDVQGSHTALRKSISAMYVRWAVTDTALSPDQQYVVYSSMSPILNIANLSGPFEMHETLPLLSSDHSQPFGVMSVSFSGADNHRLVAGTNIESLIMYNVERKEVELRIPDAHNDDVNSVAFVDHTGTLFLSASDDCLCKVWDARILRNATPVGVLVGHTEGLTHVTAKGDGRYCMTNAKDQTLKEWDLRMMAPATGNYDNVPGKKQWDYRWMAYPGHATANKHPQDCSIATYAGHSVLQTLIRCYYSPQHTTGQRYICTGSACGSVFMYDRHTGEALPKLEHHTAAVRDVAWHPSQEILFSSSWDGTVAAWENRGACWTGGQMLISQHDAP